MLFCLEAPRAWPRERSRARPARGDALRADGPTRCPLESGATTQAARLRLVDSGLKSVLAVTKWLRGHRTEATLGAGSLENLRPVRHTSAAQLRKFVEQGRNVAAYSFGSMLMSITGYEETRGTLGEHENLPPRACTGQACPVYQNARCFEGATHSSVSWQHSKLHVESC